jgi:hypothetical protein
MRGSTTFSKSTPFLEHAPVLRLHLQRRPVAAQYIEQTDLLDLRIAPLERAAFRAPSAEVEIHVFIAQRVENGVTAVPILRPLDAELGVNELMPADFGERRDDRQRSFEVLRLHVDGDVILPERMHL